jgi:hypothetical protein
VHDGEALGVGDGDGRCSHGFFRRLVSGLGVVLGFSQFCVCVCVCVSVLQEWKSQPALPPSAG